MKLPHRLAPLSKAFASALVIVALGSRGLRAIDKNGVSPQAISIPSGPGSIQGLGESFQPQLNSGSGSYSVPITLPRGTAGVAPGLALSYDTGGANGPVGVGWRIDGLHAICRNTDEGLPRYVDGPNGADDDGDGIIDNAAEIDVIDGIDYEALVPLADGSFRAESESAFIRYERSGDGWIARQKDGSRLELGLGAGARIEDGGRVFSWLLERSVDANGNAIEYGYASDPAAPAARYLETIRWGQPGAFFTAVLRYEAGRPDVFTSVRSGFEVRTALRLARIDVISTGMPASPDALRGDIDGDGLTDALIRRYDLEYDPGAHLSLLTRVTHIGNDGVAALPSLTLEYTRWTPPTSVATKLVRSLGAPSQGLDSASVELIEMNGDGLPDILDTTSQHRVFVNRGVHADGRLHFSPPQPVANAPAIDLASTRAHLADVTADAISDLVVKVTNTRFVCFDNSGDNAWLEASTALSKTDTFPVWPFDGSDGAASRSMDCDHNRCNDVLFTQGSSYRLWMLLPGGRYAKELRLPPLLCEGKVFRFDLPGTHIVDLNGDRVKDLAWIQPTRVVWWPSSGRGTFLDEPIIVPLGRTLATADIDRAGFSDLDGDAMPDLSIVRPSFSPNGVVYWLNRFERGLDGPRTVAGLPSLTTGDALRFADMNGNGSTDIIISQGRPARPGEGILVVDLMPDGKPYLLERVDNGLGLVTTFAYESSIDQMVRADEAGDPWTRRMPMPVQVLRRIAEDDGRGSVFERVLSYRDPFWDGATQEFRGFERAEERVVGDASAATKLTRTTYDTGRVADCLKGKPIAVEVLGEDGTLFTHAENSWTHRVLATGTNAAEVCYAFKQATDELHVEGRDEDAVRTRVESVYDDFGNVTAERRLGRVGQSGDEIIVERVYELRPAAWQMGLVGLETTFDGAGVVVAVKRFTYDARANLELSEAYLDTEERFVPERRMSYDSFGNIVELVDAEGRRRTAVFDAELHGMPVAETVHLADRALTSTASYDLGLGVVTSATDFAGVRTDYAHDALGRLVSATAPGGAGETYEYQLASPVSHVKKRVREDAPDGSYDSFAYFDGLGRSLGTKVESEEGRWRFIGATSYNARKLAAETWLPYFTETPAYEEPDRQAAHDAMRYDAPGRLVETTHPDGSATRAVHEPLAVVSFDENDVEGLGQPTVSRKDGLGRVVTVEERNGDEGLVTRYVWSARNELVRVVDALENVRRFGFDSLGRLVEVNDPDRGITTYEYDDTGNRTRREDATGRVTLWTYDPANRVLTEDYVEAGGADPVDVIFHYDAPAGEIDFGDGASGVARNVLGRLAYVEDLAGEEHVSYDERGNTEWTVRRVRGPDLGRLVSYRTQHGYDRMNRCIEVVYPDNDRARFVYGDGSFIERIDGGSGGRVVLESATYEATGQFAGVRLGNGVETVHGYDERDRLTSIRTTGAGGVELLHHVIGYDAASNVVSLTDERPVAELPEDSPRRVTATFDYDDLHRLVRVSYTRRDDPAALRGRIDYAYDAIANMLARTTPAAGQPGHIDDAGAAFGPLTYAGGRSGRDGRLPGEAPGPHAVTGAGGEPWLYDDSGNVVRRGDAVLEWDTVNRLTRYATAGVEASYVYDHGDRRVSRRVDHGRRVERSDFVDRWFELRDGVPTKYVFAEGIRLARVHGMLDGSRERVQRLRLVGGWNPVAAAVESSARLRDVFGADAVVLDAQLGRLQASAAVPFGEALWVFVPEARVAVLRGRYPDRVDDRGEGPGLHAWPRLEPFDLELGGAATSRLMAFDAAKRDWVLRDASLPAFLSDAPAILGGATVFWTGAPMTVRASAAGERSIVYYHGDHLRSTAVLTGASGALLEETAYSPYGRVRHEHRPATPAIVRDYAFTGKERDGESGLHFMEARYLVEGAGVFVSPDPRFVEVAALAGGSDRDRASLAAYINNPQMGNVYAYGLRNPLKYVDPDGHEVVISSALTGAPAFMKAWRRFKRTEEGRRVLRELERSGQRVYIRATNGEKLDRITGTEVGSDPVDTVVGQGTLRANEAAVLLNLGRIKRDVKESIAAGTTEYADERQLFAEIGEAVYQGLRMADSKLDRQAFSAREALRDVMGGPGAPTGGLGTSPGEDPPEHWSVEYGDDAYKRFWQQNEAANARP